ncbi:MAG: lipid A biosynthesis acyltransferase [Burkholderiales bacterium PBB4]|nr:MAG: lipid A biosynthesis acyltransferase [Burkholderiales bacterium PBB4]
MRLLFKVLSFLPLLSLHCLGWWLGWFAFLLSPTYRERLQANARQAGIERKAWLSSVGAAGKLVAELPRLWMGAPVPVVWAGETCIEEALRVGKGILFLTPHLGCFEITAQAYAAKFGQHGSPITVLFRPPRQVWLKDLVESSRDRPGLKTTPTTLAGVKHMVRALKAGECVGLLPDQVPPEGLGEWVPFFGKPAYTMTLAVRLASQTGAVVLLAWGERLPWGRGYCVHVSAYPGKDMSDVPNALQELNLAMQALVVQAPHQYLWGYARYKKPRMAVL